MDDHYLESYSFSGEQAVSYIGVLLKTLSDMGVDANNRQGLRDGLYRLFQVELCGMPDLDAGDYILASNHVSDFDAILLGLLHPRIRILSKKEWVQNEKLMAFLSNYYDIIGVDRKSSGDMVKALMELSRYLRNADSPKHVLIFPQGTISDINHNAVDRVYNGIYSLSYLTGKQILPLYLEQPSMKHKTRIAFGRPIAATDKGDHRAEWLQTLITLQDALTPPARRPTLSHKHSNNNKLGDPFF